MFRWDLKCALSVFINDRPTEWNDSYYNINAGKEMKTWDKILDGKCIDLQEKLVFAAVWKKELVQWKTAVRETVIKVQYKWDINLV